MADSSIASDMVDSIVVVDIAGPTAAADLADTATAVDIAGLLSKDQIDRLGEVALGDLLFVMGTAREAEDEDLGENEDDEDDDAEGEVDEDPVDGEQNVGASADADDHEESGEEDGSASGGDNENEDMDASDESIPADAPTPPRMFIVTAIDRNEENMITDIGLQHLTYSKTVDVDDYHSFQIYGNEIVHRHTSKCNKCISSISITNILADPSYLPARNPQGDFLRRCDYTIANNPRRQCISNCKHGWLIDRQIVNSLIAEHDSPVLAWDGDLDDVPLEAAVCPVCVGLEPLKQQERLQHTLLTTGRVDMDAILSHLGELNARRAALGYPFRQFDERLWGMYFDDMDGEEGEGNMDGGWADPYEHFPEALDPNAYIKTNPASEATIQALPRRLLRETGLHVGKCDVCMDPIKEDCMVMVLPCGHSEHHVECLEAWLRQQETCTVCRRVVPAAKLGVEPVFEEEGDEEMMKDETQEEMVDEGEAVTPQSDVVGDLHPGFPHPGKHAAIAANGMPELLPSSSWVTVEEDAIMSD